MRIQILGSPGSGIQGENGEHLEGECTVSDYFGQLLVGSGRARRVGGQTPAASPDQVQTADPTPVHRNPVAAKPARKPAAKRPKGKS